VAEIEAAARRGGMTTLRQDGDRMTGEGITTPAAVEAVLEGEVFAS
jgi:hypothetical protein